MATAPNKAPKVQESDKVPQWKTPFLTIWDENQKRIVQATQQMSVQDTIDNWGAVDYVVLAEVYDADPSGIRSMMKKLGYTLIQSNAYTFQHYTRKIKIPLEQKE